MAKNKIHPFLPILVLWLPAAPRQVQCEQLPVDRDSSLLKLASVSCTQFREGFGMHFLAPDKDISGPVKQLIYMWEDFG